MKILFLILTLLSLKVSAAEISQSPSQVASESKEKLLAGAEDRIYGIVFSKGDKRIDYDIFITRKVKQIYSFRYCHAYDSTGRPTDIAALRTQFLTGEFQNSKKLSQILDETFSSPSCESVGFTTYAQFNDAKVDMYECEYSSSRYLLPQMLSGTFGIFSVMIGSAVVYQISDTRRLKNTEGLSKFIFSKKIPYGGVAVTGALIGAAAGMGYLGFKVFPDEYQASQRFKILTDCLSDTQRKNSRASIVIEPSMDLFMNYFKTSLNEAVHSGAFSGL